MKKRIRRGYKEELNTTHTTSYSTLLYFTLLYSTSLYFALHYIILSCNIIFPLPSHHKTHTHTPNHMHTPTPTPPHTTHTAHTHTCLVPRVRWSLCFAFSWNSCHCLRSALSGKDIA